MNIATDHSTRTHGPHRLFGVDLGGTMIKWVHLDRGDVLASGSVPTPTSGADAVADAIAGTALRAGATHLGVAIPGHLTTDLSATTLLPNVVGDWNRYPLAAKLRKLTGASTSLTNDARAFATAELSLGAARGRSEVLFVTMGTGIGGAIALNGQVLHGPGDKIGEIGHTEVQPGGRVCSCGHRGCLETLAGGRNLVAAWSRLDPLQAGDPSPPRTPADLVRAASAGQSAALAVLADAGAAMGQAIGSLLGMLGYNIVVVGGGVAPAFEFMKPAVLRSLEDRTYLTGPITLRYAALGSQAGAIGAAVHAASIATELMT